MSALARYAIAGLTSLTPYLLLRIAVIDANAGPGAACMVGFYGGVAFVFIYALMLPVGRQ